MIKPDKNKQDLFFCVAKSLIGTIPLCGTAINEIINLTVSDLRMNRIYDFLIYLNDKIEDQKERIDHFQQNIKSEEGLDIFEEGIIQASRAISNERKKRLAYLVANSLTSNELKYAESRKLLNIYNELTDPEIIWLIYYSLNPVLGKGPHSLWVEKHPDVLKPISKEIGVSKEQLEKGALQDSYRLTLCRLNLTKKNGNTTTITTLGQLMIRYIDDK